MPGGPVWPWRFEVTEGDVVRLEVGEVLLLDAVAEGEAAVEADGGAVRHGDAPERLLAVAAPAGAAAGGREVVVAGVGLAPDLHADVVEAEQRAGGVVEDVHVVGEVVAEALVHRAGDEGVVVAGQDDDGDVRRTDDGGRLAKSGSLTRLWSKKSPAMRTRSASRSTAAPMIVSRKCRASSRPDSSRVNPVPTWTSEVWMRRTLCGWAAGGEERAGVEHLRAGIGGDGICHCSQLHWTRVHRDNGAQRSGRGRLAQCRGIPARGTPYTMQRR